MNAALAQQVHDITRWLRQIAPGAQLAQDSRRIAPGDVFLAFPGETGDGRHYIAQAVAAGARAVVHEQAGDFRWSDDWQVPHLAIADLSSLVARLAQDWYGAPDSTLFSVAVTGTNGKTSCSQWLGQALSRDGLPTVVVGTLGTGLFRAGVSGPFTSTGFTTPDAVQLYRTLALHQQQGARALAIEASSIGLAQGRLGGLHIDVAVLTNFTRDHLDFHQTMEAYEAAKATLFDWPGLQHAVINLDDPMGRRRVAQLRARQPAIGVIGYTIDGAQMDGVPTVSATDLRISQQGTTFSLHSPFGVANVRTRLIGRFNVSNVLAVAGVLFARGLTLAQVVAALEALVAVPGRMQQLGGHDGPLAVIDYAHTPDAVEQALQTLQPVAHARQGQLWIVLGCGGDRDPGKRAPMGAAASGADHLIVTSDNPRSEEPAAIITQILQGVTLAADRVQVIEDRAAAILSAIRQAGKNDVVLVAGKGHEDTQEIKGRRLPFRDADHAALALATRATRYGGH